MFRLFRKRADQELAEIVVNNIFPLISHLYAIRSRRREKTPTRGFRHSVMKEGQKFITYEYLTSDTPWVTPEMMLVRITGIEGYKQIEIIGSTIDTHDIIVTIEEEKKIFPSVSVCISPYHEWFSKSYIKHQIAGKMTLRQLNRLFRTITDLLETYPPVFQ